jgi:hypothetical protein
MPVCELVDGTNDIGDLDSLVKGRGVDNLLRYSGRIASVFYLLWIASPQWRRGGNTMTMRIILQNRQSRLYYKYGSEWTAEIDKATDFHQVVFAIDYARSVLACNLDVLMCFGDPKYDVRLNVPGQIAR